MELTRMEIVNGTMEAVNAGDYVRADEALDAIRDLQESLAWLKNNMDRYMNRTPVRDMPHCMSRADTMISEARDLLREHGVNFED